MMTENISRTTLEKLNDLKSLSCAILHQWTSARSVKVIDGDDWYRAEDARRDGLDYVLTFAEAKSIIQP